jgi:hypothetical protein
MHKSFFPYEKKETIVLILLLLLVFIPFLPVLSSSGERVLSYKDTDIAQQFYAYQYFIHEEFQKGRIPLWNPYLMSGTNFHGEGQPALFYPTTWLLGPFSPGTAINLHFLLHSLLLAVSFFLYLKELGLTKESSFLGSLVFALSSGPVLRIYPGHLPIYPALALAPLFLLFWERFLKNKRLRNLLLMSLIYALLIFSGHAQFLFYFSIFFVFYALWSILVTKKETRKEKGLRLLAFGLALLLGIVIASVHLLPAMNFAQNSFRHKMSYEFCSLFSFAPENFLTLLYPSFFGDRVHSPYWGRNNLWEMTAYIGVIPLLFAALGSLYARHPRKMFFLAAVTIFSLLALGGYTPLFYFLYHYAPLFDKFRGNSKLMTLVIISLSILAAFGFEILLHDQETKSKRTWKRIFITGMLLSLALVLLSAVLYWKVSNFDSWKQLVQWRYSKGETYEKSILMNEKELLVAQSVAKRSIGLTGLLAVAAAAYFIILRSKKLQTFPAGKLFLLAGITADLFLFGWKYYATFSIQEIRPPKEFVDYLSREKELYRVQSSILPPNAFMPSMIESIGGYVGNIQDRYNRFLNRAQGKPEESLQNYVQISHYSPAFRLLNIKYLILPTKSRVKSSDFHRLLSSGELTLYENKAFIPRIFFPKRVRFVGSPQEALAIVTEGDFDPRDMSIIEDQGRAGETIDCGEDHVKFQVRKYTPNEIQLEVQSSQTRFAVIGNSFEPNWKVSIDGERIGSVLPANYVLQAAWIPEGSHVVTFLFSPDSLQKGMILTGVGILAWIIIWLWGGRATKRDLPLQ